MNFHRCILYLMAVAFCASCATPYQRMGPTGGYEEEKIDEDTYVVAFHGNGYTSESKVWSFWIYRCAEIVNLKGYNFFTMMPLDDPSRAVTAVPKYSKYARVDMYKDPVFSETRSLFNAEKIMAALSDFVETNGKSEPPGRKELLLQAVVKPPM